jgi:hypothetical protein
MQIKAEVTLPYPRERVFAAYRERLAELTQYLPNIQGIRVKERKEREDGLIELVNEWSGGGDIPAVARSFLNESMLKWTDYALWDPSTFTCDWRTEVHAFPGAIESSGKNFYLATSADSTKLEIRGDLVCDATKIPGVPRLLAKTVSRAVEKVLVSSIATNLVEVGKGVGKMLSKDGK